MTEKALVAVIQEAYVQGKWLGQVVRGFFAYHAVPTNGLAPIASCRPQPRNCEPARRDERTPA